MARKVRVKWNDDLDWGGIRCYRLKGLNEVDGLVAQDCEWDIGVGITSTGFLV